MIHPQGLLIPKFHKLYWLGLIPNASITEPPPQWVWYDQYNPAPSITTYEGWGLLQDPPALVPEPNDYTGAENCVVGNFSQAAGDGAPWGWADARCNGSYVNICRMQSECTLGGCRVLVLASGLYWCCW
jgi:hypothetical protein